MATTSAPPAPVLTHLTTLSSPTGGGTRTWQTTPHLSPQHPILATASSDKSVHIWSLRDFTLLSTISNGHKRSIRTVDWKDYGGSSSTKKRRKLTLATGSFDANVGIWEHNSQATSAAEGLSLAPEPETGDGGNDSIERDMNAEEEDEEWLFSTLLTGPDSEIKSIHFSPPHYSANLLATSSRDKSVWVWEEVEDEEWETIAVLQEHAGDVKSVAWCEGARLPRSSSDTNDEDTIVGYRETLASSSYDDTIRLWRDVESEGDWVCVGVIEGHAGTVWSVKWERHINSSLYPDTSSSNLQLEWEPRLLSCSDDLTVRVWQRELSETEKEKKRNHLENGTTTKSATTARLPSIIKPSSTFERWSLQSTLPSIHVRSIYAVDWSRSTGLVVSCGGDGTIVVYREIPTLSSTSTESQNIPSGNDIDGDIPMNGTAPTIAPANSSSSLASTWSIVALIEAAHDEYEINHVCFAPRRDKDQRFEGEEVIVSTGDDGDVKIWTLPEEIVKGWLSM